MTRSLRSGLWECRLVPALCLLPELLSLFLFGDSLPSLLESHPMCIPISIRPRLKGTRLELSELSFCAAPPLLCSNHSAPTLTPCPICLLFSARLRLLSSFWGSPSWASAWKLHPSSRPVQGLEQEGSPCSFPFYRSHSSTLPHCPRERQFCVIAFIRFSCLWQDSSLHSNYFFTGKWRSPVVFNDSVE